MITEQVLARITADTTGLRRGVQESNNLLRSLSTQTRDLGRHSNASFTDMMRGIQGVEKAASSAKSTFVGFIAATGAIQMTQQAFAAAKSAVIDFNSTLEQANIGFKTMIGSAEGATKFIAELKDFAVKTPFEFSQLITASQRLMALGFAADQVQPMLRSVGDAVAALGGSMQDSGQRIIRALGQMSAKGKVSAEEMMQLSEAGISAWQYLADAYNTTTADMMERARKTAVDSGTAITAIMQGMTQDFGGMMEAQSKTLRGAMSNVVDYMEQTAGAMTMPIYEKMRDGVLAIAELFGSSEFEQKSIQMAEKLSVGIERSFDRLSEMVNTARPYAERFIESITEREDDLRSIGASIVEIAEAGGELAKSAIEVGGALTQATPPVAIELMKLVAESLSEIGALITRYEPAVKVFMGLFVASRITKWVQGMIAATQATYRQAMANNALTRSIQAQAAAELQLLAARRSAQMGNGLAMTSAFTPGMTTASVNVFGTAARQMTMAQKASAGLKMSMSNLAGVFNPVMLGVIGVTTAMAAMSANKQAVADFYASMIDATVEGAETIPEQMDKIRRALEEPLPTKSDALYSGGFLSDLKAFVWDEGMFRMEWIGLDDADTKRLESSAEAAEEYYNKLDELQRQHIADQRANLAQTHEDFLDWADNQATTFDNITENVDKELAKMRESQRGMFEGILDPFQSFRDQAGPTLDELVANLTQNTADLQAWRDNLTYLLETGNADIAAYFASLGPMSLEAMSSLVQSGDLGAQMFRQHIEDGFAAAGVSAEDAMWEGLSLIPDLAAEAGYDVGTRLTEEAQKAAARDADMSPAFETAWNALKRSAEETISTLFDTSDPDAQKVIDELVAQFQAIDPETLWDTGLDAEALKEALGIPEVSAALATLHDEYDGKENPLEVKLVIEQALRDADLLSENVQAIFDAANEQDIVMSIPQYDTVAGQLEDVYDAIKDIETIGHQDIRLNFTSNIAAIASTIERVLPGRQTLLGGPTATFEQRNDANGGIHRFANGGYLPTEALIQPPGTLVQWAEPETGGEAFIPLAATKRDRSIDIWKQVGKMFGVLPQYKFGSGGVTKPAPWQFNREEEEPSGGGGGSAPSPSKAGPYIPSGLPSIEELGNMYEWGAITAKVYIGALEGLRNSHKKYSQEWAGFQREIDNVHDDLARAEQDRLDAIEDAAREEERLRQEAADARQAALDKQRGIEDVMFAVGDMSTDKYLSLLNKRLAGTEKYSDEWYSLWSSIQQINAEAADSLASLANEMQSHTDAIFSALADSYDAIVSPIESAANFIGNLSGGAVTQAGVSGYYSHMTEALERWAKTVETLRSMGLNDNTLQGIITAGPSSLAFAESIMTGGKSMVDTINAGEANVSRLTSQFGTANMPGVSQSGTSLTIGNITIDIGEGSTLTKEDVKEALEEALDQLADYIETGVTTSG